MVWMDPPTPPHPSLLNCSLVGGHSGSFQVWAVVNKVVRNFHVQILREHLFWGVIAGL